MQYFTCFTKKGMRVNTREKDYINRILIAASKMSESEKKRLLDIAEKMLQDNASGPKAPDSGLDTSDEGGKQ